MEMGLSVTLDGRMIKLKLESQNMRDVFPTELLQQREERKVPYLLLENIENDVQCTRR